jgi:hypothetical protein
MGPQGSLHSHSLIPLTHIAPTRESSSTRIRSNGWAQRRVQATVRCKFLIPQLLRHARASGRRARLYKGDILERFTGIDKLKKEIEDGMKVTLGLMNEIETAKRGVLSNWKFKNMKLANKIRKNNEMLLYKSCIVKVVSKNWVDSIKDIYVQNEPIPNIYEQAMEVIQNDDTKIHCSFSILHQPKLLGYPILLKSLYLLNLFHDQKILFVISTGVEKMALSILKITSWNIAVKNLNV